MTDLPMDTVGKEIVLVCGDRNWDEEQVIHDRLALLPEDTVIIHGAARGADRMAGDLATEMGLEVYEFPAEWDRHGRSAGPIRNVQMLGVGPDLVIAFHHDLEGSKGTKHMVKIARDAGVRVEVIG